MKIYTITKKYNTGINVGMILTNDENKVCFESNFRVTSDKESDGHLMGIWRALSVIKNRGKNIDRQDIVCILPKDLKGWIDLRLREDRYTQHLKRMLNIEIITNNAKEEDNTYLKLAEQQCNKNIIKPIKNNEGR